MRSISKFLADRDVFRLVSKYSNLLFLPTLALTIAALPFSIRINSICVILLLLTWLFKDSIQKKVSRVSPMLILFLSLYGLHVLGLLWTTNIDRGLFELEKKSFLLAFPLILGTIDRFSERQVKTIFKCFIVSCLLLSVITLGYAAYRTVHANAFFETDPVSNYTTHYFFYFGLSDLFMHPVYLSAYVVLCFIIIFHSTLKQWYKLVPGFRAARILLMLYLITYLFLLSGRIMIISLFAICVAYMFFIMIQRGQILKSILLSFMVVSISVAIVWSVPAIRERFEQLMTSSYSFENNPETNQLLSGKLDGPQMRLAKWYFTLEAGKNSWLFGQGTGDDEDALLATYLKNNFMEGYVPQYNAHNQFLQTWLGLGVVGLAVLLLNLLVPAYLAFRQRNFLFLSFLFIIISFCLTESIFARQHGVAFYSFFNALFAFHSLKQRDRTQTAASKAE